MNNTLIFNLLSPNTKVATSKTEVPEDAGLFGEIMSAMSTKIEEATDSLTVSDSKSTADLTDDQLSELESILSSFLALILNLSEHIQNKSDDSGELGLAQVDMSKFIKALDTLGTLSKLNLKSDAFMESLNVFNEIKGSIALEIGKLKGQDLNLDALFQRLDLSKLQTTLDSLQSSILARSGEFNPVTAPALASSQVGQTSQQQKNAMTEIMALLSQAGEINEKLKEILGTLVVSPKETHLASKPKLNDHALFSSFTQLTALSQDTSKLPLPESSQEIVNSALLAHINEQLTWAGKEEAQSLFSPVEALDLDQPLINDIKSTFEASIDKNSALSTRPFQGNLNIPFASEAWQNAFNKQMLFFLKNGIQNAELRLHPQELGVINIQLSLDDNLIKLQLFSANAQVRTTMESALNQLKASFNEQGYHLDESFIGNDNQQSSNQNEYTRSFGQDNFNSEQGSNTDEQDLIIGASNVQSNATSSTRNVGIDNFI